MNEPIDKPVTSVTNGTMTMGLVSRAMFGISFLTILAGLVFGAIFIYWLVYPYNVTSWDRPTFQVLTPTVVQGGTLVFHSNYCKNIEISATVSREFINGLIFSTPEFTNDRATGCHSIDVAVPIPQELPEGKYRLRTLYKFPVNPARTILITHDTDVFTVKEATPSAR